MKVSDYYQSHVLSFMHDIVNNKLSGSFNEFTTVTNNQPLNLRYHF